MNATAIRGVVLGAAVAISAQSTVWAQGLDAERFAPAVGAASEVAVESAVVPAHLRWGAGLFFNFTDDPVVERELGDGDVLSRPLDHSLSADLVASLGLFRLIEIGVHLPVRLIYDGDDFASGGEVLAASRGIGDVRLVPKVELWGAGDQASHIVIGFAAPVALPTGNDEAMRGSGGITVTPRFLAVAQLGPVRLGSDLGFAWRSQTPSAYPWGHELQFAASLSYAILDALDLRADLIGGVHITDAEGPAAPIEALGGIGYRITESMRLFAGAGPGLSDGLGSPDFRAFAGLRFAPGFDRHDGFGDSDGDGILDRHDDCPDDPEDEDGFADDDGCPESDNDRDGILDDVDACPELPEEEGGNGDGCPARTFVKVEDGELIIFGQVRFKTGSDEINSESQPLLDQIAAALHAHPELGSIRVEGHTDSVGDDQVNLVLSKRRAESVERALVSRGVDEGRLSRDGYGEHRPVAPNKTAAGRAKNRRVEFVVVGK